MSDLLLKSDVIIESYLDCRKKPPKIKVTSVFHKFYFLNESQKTLQLLHESLVSKKYQVRSARARKKEKVRV